MTRPVILLVQVDDAVHVFAEDRAETALTVTAVAEAAGVEGSVFRVTPETWEARLRPAVLAAGGAVYDHREAVTGRDAP